MEIKINKKTLIDAINKLDKNELNEEIEKQIEGDDTNEKIHFQKRKKFLQ